MWKIVFLMLVLVWHLWTGKAFLSGTSNSIDSQSDPLVYGLVILGEIGLIIFLMVRS